MLSEKMFYSYTVVLSITFGNGNQHFIWYKQSNIFLQQLDSFCFMFVNLLPLGHY